MAKAKVAKTNHKPKVNPRSRAAKRQSSPSANLDKSLESTARATTTNPVLGIQTSNGIQKKRKRTQLKRGQHKRQEKGMARAAIIGDKLEKRQETQVTKTKRVRNRRAVWEEINEEVSEQRRKTPGGWGLEAGQDAVVVNGEAEEGWEDEEQEERTGDGDADAEMKFVDGVVLPASAALNKIVLVERTASSRGSVADMEEIT